VHHLFPKNYLKKQGFTKGKYNQIANYVMMQSEINIAVGDKAPSFYFGELFEQTDEGLPAYGGISDRTSLKDNLRMHCIPSGIEEMTIEDYDDFLQRRRVLMAEKIKVYYSKL
jgi:hypothetical protein